MKTNNPKIYLITPPKINENTFISELNQVLDSAIVGCLQVRLKNENDFKIIKLCNEIKPICDQYNIPLILNDRLDLVESCNVDGVHLGEKDKSIKWARKVLGPNYIIGSSCYNSKHLAMEAAEDGADYVAFGAFFESKTKIPKARADVSLVEEWNLISNVPCVAIGGITAMNCKTLIKAGIDQLAVINSIWNNSCSPEQAILEFKKILN